MSAKPSAGGESDCDVQPAGSQNGAAPPVGHDAELLAGQDAVPPAGQGAAHRPRIRRRVRTEPVPGSDPTPEPEPSKHSVDENDERLKLDKPPHWG